MKSLQHAGLRQHTPLDQANNLAELKFDLTNVNLLDSFLSVLLECVIFLRAFTAPEHSTLIDPGTARKHRKKYHSRLPVWVDRSRGRCLRTGIFRSRRKVALRTARLPQVTDLNNERTQDISDRYLSSVEEINRIMYSGRLHEWQGMDLSISQFNTLVMLKQMGSMRMGMISYYLKNTLAATTSIVDRLEKKGLVVRTKDPEDRRVVICELTEEGQKATERFWRVAREAALRVAGKWDQEQLESVVNALELILRTHKEIVQSGVSSRANE